jgi:hypothetical protein
MVEDTTDIGAGTDRALPPHLAAVGADRIIDLDVREDLRNGREPFSRILAACRALGADGVLRLRAIFEPVPLYAVLEKQGLAHWTDRRAADDWIVWFHPTAAVAADPVVGTTAAAPAAAAPASMEPVVLDVTGLEPPEPMIRTLEALEALPPGGTLIQLNVRVPQFLLPQLRARGFTYQVHEEANDRVRLVIHAPVRDTPPTGSND